MPDRTNEQNNDQPTNNRASNDFGSINYYMGARVGFIAGSIASLMTWIDPSLSAYIPSNLLLITNHVRQNERLVNEEYIHNLFLGVAPSPEQERDRTQRIVREQHQQQSIQAPIGTILLDWLVGLPTYDTQTVFRDYIEPSESSAKSSEHDEPHISDRDYKPVNLNIDQDIEDELEKPFKCALTGKVMSQPVIASDGYAYDKQAIINHLQKDCYSPQTNELLSNIVYPNYRLRKMLQDRIEQMKHNQAVDIDHTCPISHEAITHPAVAADGQVYERQFIQSWLQHHNKSPMTGKELPNTNLYTGHNFDNAVNAIKISQPDSGLSMTPRNG